MLAAKANAADVASPQPSTIRVYNTLTNRKEVFETVAPGKVGIYLCGPTVYKPSHIGHMVGPIIFDVIKRYLVYRGFEVTLVVNITDVDDKLINESNARGMSMKALAEEMTADYRHNLAAMGVDSIDHFPKATENMDGIVRITRQLIDRGYAYASDGDVYFDVLRDAEYGKLSNRTIEHMQGGGGDTADRKRSPMDFALWKSAKPGEPSWESPWGPGRPGWHIECSAMSREILGETFDIHGGGLDLVFPHHENEIAQSECCHGKPQARYWLHNGLMQAADEAGKVGGRATRTLAEGDQEAQAANKISKSTGAGPFRDLLARHAPEAIRMLLLSTHYRSPILFSEGEIAKQAERLDTFYRFFKRYQRVTGESFYSLQVSPTLAGSTFSAGGSELLQGLQDERERFLEKMDDDFNTAGGIATLYEVVNTLNRFVEQAKLETGKPAADKVAELKAGSGLLKELAGAMGLFREAPAKPASGANDELLNGLVKLLVEVRAESRKAKNFAMADKIRNDLTALGVQLEDRPDGTEWTFGQ